VWNSLHFSEDTARSPLRSEAGSRLISDPKRKANGKRRSSPRESGHLDTRLSSHISSLIAAGSRVRLFEGLSEQEREAVVAAASPRRFSSNSTVIRQGEPADKLFLLMKGSARFFFITPGGRTVYLLWLRPGEIFGAASLLTTPECFLVSTEVTKDTQVLVWQRDAIRNLALRYPRLVENVLSIASDYLVWYLASHLSLIYHSARKRLAHVLTSLAAGIGRKCADGVCLDITNEQLADTVNITPFTASRLLSEWQRAGIIVKSRGRILLCHPERLFRRDAKAMIGSQRSRRT
jgi:CRP/FNR family transcriptional regulator, nitrogen oxide reductase regulator